MSFVLRNFFFFTRYMIALLAALHQSDKIANTAIILRIKKHLQCSPAGQCGWRNTSSTAFVRKSRSGLFDKNSVSFPGFLALIGRVPSQSAKNPELFVFGRSGDLEIYGKVHVPDVADGAGGVKTPGADCIDDSPSGAIVRGIPAVPQPLSNACNRGERASFKLGKGHASTFWLNWGRGQGWVSRE